MEHATLLCKLSNALKGYADVLEQKTYMNGVPQRTYTNSVKKKDKDDDW